MDKGAKGEDINWGDLQNYNVNANEKWNEESLAKCEFCNRTFLPERFPIHRKVCTAEKPFKPLPAKGAKGVPAEEPVSKMSAPSKTTNPKVGGGMGGGGVKPVPQKQEQYDSDDGEDFATQSKPTPKISGAKKPTMNAEPGPDVASMKAKASGGYNIPQGAVEDLDLVPCGICGRNFAADRIGKHQSACQKAQKGEAKHAKKVAKVQKEQEKKEQEIAKEVAGKKPNWKAQHEDFVNNLKFQRKVKQVEEAGGDIRSLGPAPVTQAADNLVPCPYCNRRFNQIAADRHIPSCKNIINKPKPPPQMRPGQGIGPSGAYSSTPYQNSTLKMPSNTTNTMGSTKAPANQDKFKSYDGGSKGMRSSVEKPTFKADPYSMGGGSNKGNTISYDDPMGKSKGVGMTTGMGLKSNVGTSYKTSSSSYGQASSAYGQSPQIKSGMKTLDPKPQPTSSTRASATLNQSAKPQQGGGYKLYQNNNANAYHY
jgi:hypothetical protein